MPTHAEKRRMPYSADEMFALIADVEDYPKFLPWCAGCRVRGRRPAPEGQIIDADLVISFKVFRENFGSRVTLNADARRIDVSYLDGPFKYLNNRWHFEPISDVECEVDFFVDFEFRSKTLQAIIGVVFNEAMRRIVRAFEDRARALYGERRLSA
ncbi:MAG: type II toxin-antitoxin system RatA family toxin [Pseudomonadota bacterium]